MGAMVGDCGNPIQVTQAPFTGHQSVSLDKPTVAPWKQCKEGRWGGGGCHSRRLLFRLWDLLRFVIPTEWGLVIVGFRAVLCLNNNKRAKFLPSGNFVTQQGGTVPRAPLPSLQLRPAEEFHLRLMDSGSRPVRPSTTEAPVDSLAHLALITVVFHTQTTTPAFAVNANAIMKNSHNCNICNTAAKLLLAINSSQPLPTS